MTTSEISKYQVRWVVIDSFSHKKIFKYQEKELRKMGFVVIRKPDTTEVCKHYRDLNAAISDAASIRRAFSIVRIKRPNAIGSIMTDAQFGGGHDWKEPTIVRTTTKQQELFRAIVGERNHPHSDYQPEMFA